MRSHSLAAIPMRFLCALLPWLVGLPAISALPSLFALPSLAVAQTALIVTTEGTGEPPHMPDTAPILAALEARGLSPMRDVSERIVAKHSAPPVRPPDDHLAKLRAELEAVTRHLALGELQQAIERMRAIETMQADALDFLSREAAQARKLFDACVMTGYLLHQNGRTDEGKDQLRMCAASFPGFQLHKEVFTASVRRLYSEVISHNDQRPVWLTVEGVGAGPDCEVRLNGVNVGRAPITMRARPSTVRVQLECGAHPGRIHELGLTDGKRRIDIDPVLEAGLDTDGAIPHLHHATEPARPRLVRQLLELAHAIGAQYVVRLHGAGARWSLSLVDVARGGMGQPVACNPAEPTPALDRLFPDPAAAARAQANDGADYPEGPRAERSLVGTGPVHPAYWVSLVAVWVLSPVASAVVLSDRREIRSRAGRIAALDGPDDARPKLERLNRLYNRDAMLGFVGAGVPSLAWAGSAPFLPDTEAMPWYGWAAGGLGAALVGAGAIALAAADRCTMTDRSEECGHWAADPLFAPLLFTHAVAPLSVPITYWIADALDVSPERASASITASADSGSITLRGSF